MGGSGPRFAALPVQLEDLPTRAVLAIQPASAAEEWRAAYPGSERFAGAGWTIAYRILPKETLDTVSLKPVWLSP